VQSPLSNRPIEGGVFKSGEIISGTLISITKSPRPLDWFGWIDPEHELYLLRPAASGRAEYPNPPP
jgi:hypothetical protein